MNIILPNCRIQFTSADLDFLTRTLGRQPSDADALKELLQDPAARDLILDNETLFHALLESPACLNVSTHFYFYVLVRRVLLRNGIADRAIADYVAEVLAEYSQIDRSRYKRPGDPASLDYFVDLLGALEAADDRTRFLIRAHIGNQSLFTTGIFPQHLEHRREYKAAPGIGYYESLGAASFREASHHRLAAKHHLDEVFDQLGHYFHTIRIALNDMADRLITIASEGAGLITLGKPLK